jgi:hypothetical protein
LLAGLEDKSIPNIALVLSEIQGSQADVNTTVQALGDLISASFAAVDQRIRDVRRLAWTALLNAAIADGGLTYHVISASNLHSQSIAEGTTSAFSLHSSTNYHLNFKSYTQKEYLYGPLDYSPNSILINTDSTDPVTCNLTGYTENGTTVGSGTATYKPKSNWKFNLLTVHKLKDIVSKMTFGGGFYISTYDPSYKLGRVKVDVSVEEIEEKFYFLVRGDALMCALIHKLLTNYGVIYSTSVIEAPLNSNAIYYSVPGTKPETDATAVVPSGSSLADEVSAAESNLEGKTKSTFDILVGGLKVLTGAAVDWLVSTPVIAETATTALTWVSTFMADVGISGALSTVIELLAPYLLLL